MKSRNATEIQIVIILLGRMNADVKKVISNKKKHAQVCPAINTIFYLVKMSFYYLFVVMPLKFGDI